MKNEWLEKSDVISEKDPSKLPEDPQPGNTLLRYKDPVKQPKCAVEDKGYHHPKYDPHRYGKVCQQCGKQKLLGDFSMRGYEAKRRKLDYMLYHENCKACNALDPNVIQGVTNYRPKPNPEDNLDLPDVLAHEAAQMRERMKHRRLKKMKEQASINGEKGQRVKKEKAERTAQQKALQELASRKLAKEHLLPFIQRYNDQYQAGWVHKLICKKLEKFARDIEEKKSPRLMIFQPPRSGKSEIASKTFPAWLLGHYPHFEIIAASYAVSLPMGFSRKVKDLIGTKSYQNVFAETQLNSKAQAAEAWLTTAGGGYVAAGVGGGITGKGAHCLIIDDPVKDAEEADSETQREKVWDWYGTTAYTRLAPGGGVLIIQTRWHDDDLSGRLLRQQKQNEQRLTEQIESIKEEMKTTADESTLADLEYELAKYEAEFEDLERWEVLVFPQEATQDEYYNPKTDEILYEPQEGCYLLRREGEPLHPERFNRRLINQIKNTMQPRHWSALHQQNPVPDEGVYFTKSMFRYEPIVPDWRKMDLYIAGDLAIGQKEHNDYTVLIVGAMDYESRLHIIDMIRFRGGTDLIVQNTVGLLKRYQKRVAKFGLEQGAIQMAIWPQLIKAMREAKVTVPIAEGKQGLRPLTDKSARARIAQGMMQQGRILLPSNQPWVEDLVAELLRFPSGVHDDIVDAVAWLARLTVNAQPPKERKPQGFKSWKSQLLSTEKGEGHLNA